MKKIKLSDKTIDELNEKNLKVSVEARIGEGYPVNIHTYDPEHFRIKKQLEDFDVRGKLTSFTWKDVFWALNPNWSKVYPEDIYETCFKAVKACKGTDFEWTGAEKIADKIEKQLAYCRKITHEHLIEIIESGGK